MTPPPLTQVLETCLYTKNVANAVAFYQGALGLEPFTNMERMAGFSLGSTTLLIFQLGLTTEDIRDSTGTIPHHGPTKDVLDLLLYPSGKDFSGQTGSRSLQQHFCLAVQHRDDVLKWEAWFQEKNVKILGVKDWQRGGRSVYFEDPDGHIGEIGSRGIWPHY